MSGRSRLAILVVVLVLATPVAAQVIDLDKPQEEKPEIWAKASADAVKKAEEAARKDACLRLVEAAYRLPVSGERDVLDMMIKNTQVDQDLIKGLGTAKAVKADYLGDGTVRMMVATTPLEVQEILRKAYAKVDWDQAEEDAVIAAVATQTKADTQILAEGEGALEGSTGARKIPVRRAALAKAQQEIALKVLRLVIREGDYWLELRLVRDFALTYEQVPKKIALGISTGRIHSETFADDGSVRLRAEVNVINVVDLVCRAQALYDKGGKFRDWTFSSLRTSSRDMIFGADATAKSGDPAPKNTPLALELTAVDLALKVPVKEK